MKKTLLLSLLIGSVCLIKAQQVSTFFNSSLRQVDDALIQDEQGNIYGSHYTGSNVYKISPQGNASIFYSGLNTPNALAFDSQKNLHIVDNQGNKVHVVDTSGQLIRSITISNPSGIIKAIDSDTMIVTQFSLNAVRKIAPNGMIINVPIQFGHPLDGPVGLCYGSDSSLYIGNFNDRKIYRFYQDTLSYLAQIPGNQGINLGFITYSKGWIYGTGFQNNKIFRVHPTALDSVEVYAGSSAGNLDGSLGQAKFNGPNGIISSYGADSLLISDFNTGNIRIISGIHLGDFHPIKKTNQISIFPVPNNGNFNVQTQFEMKSIKGISPSGKLVFFYKDIKANEFHINDVQYHGLLIISIQSKDDEVQHSRIVLN